MRETREENVGAMYVVSEGLMGYLKFSGSNNISEIFLCVCVLGERI